MYAALWRLLPGPTWAKVLQSLLLILAVVAFCFLWLFPRISPLLPFTDNTVEGSAAAAGIMVLGARPFSASRGTSP